jgi:hypothetical protein
MDKLRVDGQLCLLLSSKLTHHLEQRKSLRLRKVTLVDTQSTLGCYPGKAKRNWAEYAWELFDSYGMRFRLKKRGMAYAVQVLHVLRMRKRNNGVIASPLGSLGGHLRAQLFQLLWLAKHMVYK